MKQSKKKTPVQPHDLPSPDDIARELKRRGITVSPEDIAEINRPLPENPTPQDIQDWLRRMKKFLAISTRLVPSMDVAQRTGMTRHWRQMRDALDKMLRRLGVLVMKKKR